MRVSYSSDGQDLIVRTILNKDLGTYLDIGASHPTHHSNTYLFYELGWEGVAVEPNVSVKREWSRIRPRDKFYNKAFNGKSKKIKYFQHPSLSTLNSTSKLPTNSRGFEVEVGQITTTQIETISGREIMEISHSFDLVSIDTEGSEFEILNDLFQLNFQFSVIVIEVSNINLSRNLANNKIVELCDRFGFKPIAKTLHDLILIDIRNELLGRFPKQMIE